MEIYFLKRIISVEVNEARGINHYKVKDMFDELDDDGLGQFRTLILHGKILKIVEALH